MTKTALLPLLLMCFFSLLVLNSASAQDNLKLKGVLIVPPDCTINNNELIEVPFGDNLGIHKIDGVNYMQPVDYHLECEENRHDWTLQLKVSGSPSDLDSAAIATNLTDLAIYLQLDNSPLTLNEWYPISAEAPPKMTAVPIKRAGSTLPAEAFDATATLQVEYQ